MPLCSRLVTPDRAETTTSTLPPSSAARARISLPMMSQRWRCDTEVPPNLRRIQGLGLALGGIVEGCGTDIAWLSMISHRGRPRADGRRFRAGRGAFTPRSSPGLDYVLTRYYTMPMKKPSNPKKPLKAGVEALAQAFTGLKNADQVYAFLIDLCTPAELEALADRWQVVEPLTRGVPYRQIHEDTGVSVTTIGRVARCLELGTGGYRLALKPARKGGTP